MTLKTFKYKLSYNLSYNQKNTQEDTQQLRMLNTYTGHPKHEAVKARPFSLCQRYSHHVPCRPRPSGRLALHSGPGPVVLLVVGLPVLAPALLAGVELLQLHLLHLVRDPDLLPGREQGLQLGQLL